MTFIGKTASELATLISSGEASSQEITKEFFDRSEALNHKTFSYLHLNRHNAMGAAKIADDERAAGKIASPLHGVPIAVKDVLTTTDAPTTSGSKILEGWMPQYDATVVRKLREARLPILGKTNMDEFAMGSSPSTRPTDHLKTRGISRAYLVVPAAVHPQPLQDI
jgi:aspartyl-tRNA(Asn)/glutamyl-tRNA(Gln) amidotransferase subunit A